MKNQRDPCIATSSDRPPRRVSGVRPASASRPELPDGTPVVDTVVEDVEPIDEEQIVTLEEKVDPDVLRALADPSLPSPLGDEPLKPIAEPRDVTLAMERAPVSPPAANNADETARVAPLTSALLASIPDEDPPASRPDVFGQPTPLLGHPPLGGGLGFPPPLPLGPTSTALRVGSVSGPPSSAVPQVPSPFGPPPPPRVMDDPRTKTALAFVGAFLVTLLLLLVMVLAILRTR